MEQLTYGEEVYRFELEPSRDPQLAAFHQRIHLPLVGGVGGGGKVVQRVALGLSLIHILAVTVSPLCFSGSVVVMLRTAV